jgi:hypothetical protein
MFGLEDVKMVRCFNVLSKCLLGGVADAGSKIWSALSRHNGDLTACSIFLCIANEHMIKRFSPTMSKFVGTLGPADF